MARKKDPQITLHKAFRRYNVCIVSLVTGLSKELWNMYTAVNGTRNETYASYQDLPAIYVDACKIMDAECASIDHVQRKTSEAVWQHAMGYKK